MKVALAIARLSGGGAERSTMLLIKRLMHAHGVEFDVYTRGPVSGVLAGVRVFATPACRSSRWVSSASYIGLSVPRLVARKPYIIHAVQAYSPATIGVLAKSITRAPVIVKLTGSAELGEVAEIRRLPFSRTRVRLLSRVDRFVALTRIMGAELQSLGIPADRIEQIPNGVEIPPLAGVQRARKEVRRILGIGDSRFVALFVGRLSSEKRIDVLINAWREVTARIPDAVLLIVGAGGGVRDVEQPLRTQAASAVQAGSVVFVGQLADPQAYYAAADVFVLPSESEGMSNALLEAMASGLPVVTTQIPANEEVVQDGVHGVAVPAGDSRVLAEALLALAGEPDVRARMGAATRRTIEEGFSIDSVAGRYYDLYRRLNG